MYLYESNGNIYMKIFLTVNNVLLITGNQWITGNKNKSWDFDDLDINSIWIPILTIPQYNLKEKKKEHININKYSRVLLNIIPNSFVYEINLTFFLIDCKYFMNRDIV